MNVDMEVRDEISLEKSYVHHFKNLEIKKRQVFWKEISHKIPFSPVGNTPYSSVTRMHECSLQKYICGFS